MIELFSIMPLSYSELGERLCDCTRYALASVTV
jgi:hypothetical protein